MGDDVLRWGGTAHLREPSQVSRAPIGPAHVPAIVSEQKGFETICGVCEIADSIFPRTGKITNSFLFHLREIDSSEISRTS